MSQFIAHPTLKKKQTNYLLAIGFIVTGLAMRGFGEIIRLADWHQFNHQWH